ncbi:ABC transporter substrate-binding protein [Endozoicomonas acroporae]|uniref:ABC transporter substrate-binding protein n=1 Tax=Endozoicomonas acroporae TaxID=1701104 RepID=UPI000C76148E|nr:ABC transporter substrate-binding protein [Endozoicomonas acroporae]
MKRGSSTRENQTIQATESWLAGCFYCAFRHIANHSGQRILKPETAAGYASLLYTIKGAEEYNTGKAGPEALAVKAIDDSTLEITLSGPAPYFIAQLAHYTAYPVPSHKIEELGKNWAKDSNMVSNGAFTLSEWTPNAQIRLEKKPAILRRCECIAG